jgi:hypothetical protein
VRDFARGFEPRARAIAVRWQQQPFIAEFGNFQDAASV